MGPAPAMEPESSALPRPGEVLDGKYRLLRVIGEGGMGVVFEAVHVKLGQRVAIKVLQPEIAVEADLVERFEREARAAGRLRGRNVARVTDVDASPGHLPYIVMEYLEGHDLETELSNRPGRRIPIEEAIDLVLQACRAIAEAHAAGIVHRDLKPSNLFLCSEGGERVVKLLDFGVSKMEDEASKLTSTQLVIGTVHYMSPEQVRSAKDVDARTDVWALSVILYELLAGTPPFVGSATSVAVSIVNDEAPPFTPEIEVPLGLDAAIRKGLAKKPAARFGDVVSLARAIAPFGVRGPQSAARWMDETVAPVVVIPSIRPDAALGTARTVHDSASSSSGPLLPMATARSAQERTEKGRRGNAARVIAGAAAIAAAVAVIAFTASRAPAAHAPTTPAVNAPAAAPAPASPPDPIPVASDPAPAVADAPPASVAMPVATGVTSAKAAPRSSHPRSTSAPTRAPIAAPSPAPAKSAKPPLVAPF